MSEKNVILDWTLNEDIVDYVGGFIYTDRNETD